MAIYPNLTGIAKRYDKVKCPEINWQRQINSTSPTGPGCYDTKKRKRPDAAENRLIDGFLSGTSATDYRPRALRFSVAKLSSPCCSLNARPTMSGLVPARDCEARPP